MILKSRFTMIYWYEQIVIIHHIGLHHVAYILVTGAYHVYSLTHGKLESTQLYVSYGAGRIESSGLLPILTVNTDLLVENENTDNWIIR